jgi:hypothetical protein
LGKKKFTQKEWARGGALENKMKYNLKYNL